MKKIPSFNLIELIIEWLFYSFLIFIAACIITTLNGEMSWSTIRELLTIAPFFGLIFLIKYKIEDYQEQWKQRKISLQKQDAQRQQEFMAEIKRLTQ